MSSPSARVRRSDLALFVVALLAIALPAAADSFEFFAAALGGQNHGFGSLTATDWRLHAGRGAEAGFDWFPVAHLSTEVSIGSENERMNLGAFRETKFHIIPAAALIEFHPLTQTVVQPYIGAGVSYLMFRGGRMTPYGRADQPDHAALTTNAGFDFVTSSHWRIMVGAEYGPARSTAEVVHPGGKADKIDYHQLYITTGMRYRF